MTEPSTPQEDYDAFLDTLHGIPDGITDDRTGFTIADDSLADWALRRLGRLESAKYTRAAYVAAEIERLKAWQQHEDLRDQRSIDFFTGHLHRYADDLKATGVITGQKKRVTLPHGTLSFRAKDVTFVRNDEELLAWAKPLGLTKTKEGVDWEAIKGRLVVEIEQTAVGETYQVIDRVTGEHISGVRVDQAAHDAFSAKPILD